jgi:pimeloyl-ACP methyl ester carboxylesterase
VATVIVPLAAPPAGGRPLLSYQPAEDTLSRDCASSYEIRQGKMPELPEAMVPLLKDGAALVVPDYEGPESQWVAGVQAGHAVLDAIRATERFVPADLDGAKTHVAVWGYSGGAQATAWAAELQPRYAPELDLVASAHGAAPYVLRKTVAYLDGSPYAGILLAAVVGMGRAYPEMRLDEMFNEAGRAMKANVSDQCIEQFAAEYPGARLDDFTRVPNAKDLPNISRVIDADDLGHRTPEAATYLYQSTTDELEPVAGADAIVENYCRRGVAVQYVRAPAGEHIEFQIRGAPAAAAYIADRFAGKPAPNTCTVKPDPQPRRCTLVIRLRHRRGERIRRVVARVAGRRIVRRGRNLRRLRVRGLSPGRHTIRLRLRTTRGRRTLVVHRRARCP